MSSIPKLLKLKDYITLVGTSCGLSALICAVIAPYFPEPRTLLSLGFFLVVISVGTDTLDGYVARKTNTVNQMGKEMDSLSDSLTFGIAPAILLFQSFRTGTLYDIVLGIGCVCFALGAMLRLARFNISEDAGYTGVPTPLSALLVVVFFYWNYFYAYALGGPGPSGLTYPFPLFSKIIAPFLFLATGYFNITIHLSFGEKGKKVYSMFLIFAPIVPVLGILGILTHDVLADYSFGISIFSFIFFLGAFLIELSYLIFGFYIKYKQEKKAPIPEKK